MGATRYRCTACGNLTRFDVVTDRRTRAFHHYSVGGELTVEEEQVLSEQVVDVSCRWCGHGRAVEALSEGEALAEGEALSEGETLAEGETPAGAEVSHPPDTLSSTTSDREPRGG